MPSDINRIPTVLRREPPELLEDSPPPYESIDPPPYERVDPNPVCIGKYISDIVSKAYSRTILDRLRKTLYRARGGSQEASKTMSCTIEAFESAMAGALTDVRSTSVTFDSARTALLMAAMTTSLASIRGYALAQSFLCPYGMPGHQTKFSDVGHDINDTAELAGINAGIAAISGVRQLDISPVPPCVVDAILRRVAWKAATTAVQGIIFENTTQSRTVTGIVDALDNAIRAGIDSGGPFSNSLAVFETALMAALVASRSGIAFLSLTPGERWCRSKPCMAEAENNAVEFAVTVGKLMMPLNLPI